MEVHNSNSLVNFSNSILKNFGVKTLHDSIPELDEIIKGHKKVVVLLFDGMGQNIIHKHLKENSAIRSHYVHTINSTLPPTTAAATTAFLSAKYPIETGWLGWMQYMPKYDRNMIMFLGIDYNTGEKIEENGRAIALNLFLYKSIIDLIKECSPETQALNISQYPVQAKGPKKLYQGRKELKKALKGVESEFIYFYWGDPDFEMHQNGIDAKVVNRTVKRIDRFVKKVTKDNPDTQFLTFADHGHINCKYLDICEHDDIYSCLSKYLTLEKRTASFFVKNEKRNEFERLFNKYYGEYFDFFTKEEAINIKLFGEGEPVTGVLDTIGDYIAVAKYEYSIYASKETKDPGTYKGHHAGGTKEERLIDISAFNR